MKKIKFTFYFCIMAFIIINFRVSANAATQSELKQQIGSETAVLIDGDTGQVLFEKNMHQKMYPASITKVMTALLALENGNLSDSITMSYDAVFSVGRDTSHIALDVDEQLTLEQALYALAIVSANDAANGIAECISGTMDDFAKTMNSRAKEAGTLNSNFTNANGLHDDNHYTTAYDMARITMAAAGLIKFTEIFSTTYYEMEPTNKQPEQRFFWSKNAMMVGNYKYDGIIAGKTGWTSESQHTLVTVAKRDDRTLIAVVMKSSNTNDKWIDTTALLDYGFNEFNKISFNAEELSKENYPISNTNGINTYVDLSTVNNFSCLIKKSLSKEYIEVRYAADHNNAMDKLSAKATFSLKTASSALMYPELGELEMQVDIYNDLEDKTLAEDEAILNSEQQDGVKQKNSILTTGLIVIGVFFMIIIFLRIRILRIRRANALQRMKRRRYKNSYKDIR